MKKLFALLAFAACTAQASDLTYGAHLLSFHADDSRFRTLTPGVYARTEEGWIGGALFNSEGKFSIYGGRTFGKTGWQLTLGGIAGYQRAKLLPLIVPSYQFESKWRLSLLPNPWERGASALHLSKEF